MKKFVIAAGLLAILATAIGLSSFWGNSPKSTAAADNSSFHNSSPPRNSVTSKPPAREVRTETVTGGDDLEIQAAIEAKYADVGTRLDALKREFVRLAREEGETSITKARKFLNHGELNLILPDVVAAWAKTAPEEALSWYLKHASDDSLPLNGSQSLRFALLDAAFTQLGGTKIDKVISNVTLLETEAEVQVAIASASLGAVMKGEQLGLLEAGMSLPDPGQRVQLQAQIFSDWASLAPKEARAAFEKELTADEQKPLVALIGGAWMQSDPDTASHWWLEHCQPDERPEAVAAIINTWAVNAPNAAQVWLDSQPEGAAKDSGRASFAHDVFERDPDGSLAWATTIGNDDQRKATWIDLLHTLYLRNPTHASAILKASNLPPDWKKSIEEFMPPPSVKGEDEEAKN